MTAPLLLAVLLAVTDPGQDLERGRTAFFRAEYQRAIEILRPLLYPELRLDSENEVLQAHRMLGVAYLFENQRDQARREFRKLLELRPDYRFDPLLDPPRVVDFFNDVVKEQQAKLDEIEAHRRKRGAEQEAAARLIHRYERRSPIVSFFPFGAGQFQNGEPAKGWSFFGAQLGLAAISVGAFVTNFALYGARPVRDCKVPVIPTPTGGPGMCPPEQIDRSAEDLSRNLTRVQVTSGVLFFGVAIWGIVDAVRNFRPEVPVDDKGGGADPNPRRGQNNQTGARLFPTGRGLALTVTF